MIVYIRRPKKGLRHQKFQALYSGPYIIDSALGNDNFKLRHAETGKTLVSHANRLKYGTAREQIVRHNDPDMIEGKEEEESLAGDGGPGVEGAPADEREEGRERTPSPPPSLPDEERSLAPRALAPQPQTTSAQTPRRSARLKAKNKSGIDAAELSLQEWPPLPASRPNG